MPSWLAKFVTAGDTIAFTELLKILIELTFSVFFKESFISSF